MRLTPLIAMSLVASLALCSSVSAQCPTWIPGQFDNGAAVNGTDGDVNVAMMWDPDGAGPLPPVLVIGGSFTSVQGVPALHIAMQDPVTGKWQALGTGVATPVNVMTVWNGKLAIGSDGDADSTTYDNDILTWDGTTWTSLGGGTNVGVVSGLTVLNGDLYAGGNFKISYAGALGIAKWDPNGNQWVAVPGLIPNSTRRVVTLATWNNGIVAGLSGNNNSAGFLYFFNGTSWTFEADTNGPIYALQPFNGELAVGGNFTIVNGGEFAFPSVFAWDGATTIHSYAPGGTNGAVRCLTVYGGQLYIAGNFSTVGSVTPAGNTAVLSGGIWQAYAGTGVDATVLTMIPSNADLVLGGRFLNVNGHAASRLARWSGGGVNWTSFGGGYASFVNCMTVYTGRLVLGGEFHQSDDPLEPVHEIGAWDGSTLYSFGTGMDGPLNALKAYAYGPFSNQTLELVAGGHFQMAGQVAASNIAVWDQKATVITPRVWQPMGAGFNGTVLAIERATVGGVTSTYAGGTFSNVGPNVALWNPGSSTWSAVGGGLNGPVNALKAYGGTIYAGGNFTAAPGGLYTPGGFAVSSGGTWLPAEGAGGRQFPGVVQALEVFNGKLVIGGSFSGLDSGPNLEQWDGTSYSGLGAGGADGEVLAIHAFGSRLYIGGEFTHVGGVAAQYVAYWDGSAWHDASGGVDNFVASISDFGGEVQVGGSMLNAGSPPVGVPRWARQSVTGMAWFARQPLSQSLQVGSNASFTAAPASGYGNSGEQWFRFGAPLSDGPTGWGSTISGSSTTTLSLTNIAHNDYGEYQAIVTTLCGPDSSVVASLTPGGSTTVGDPGRITVSRFESIEPNPSHGPGTVAFALAHPAGVEMRVLDLTGRRVARFVLGNVGVGHHRLSWVAKGEDGRTVRPGLYFVSLMADGQPLGSKRIAIIR
jgi:hypothetical protein